MQDTFVTNGSWTKCQAKKKVLFLKQMVLKFYRIEVLWFNRPWELPTIISGKQN